MLKLLGSLLIFAGGACVWRLRIKEQRRRRTVLAELVLTLRHMQEEIRMMRTPMPELLKKMAESCGQETAQLLKAAATAAEQGETVGTVWRQQLLAFPLDKTERGILSGLSFQGDEEKLCKELSFAAYELAKCAEDLDRCRPEEEKRTTALCFSCAALVVILLI